LVYYNPTLVCCTKKNLATQEWAGGGGRQVIIRLCSASAESLNVEMRCAAEKNRRFATCELTAKLR
jgi:hypothetical protein